MENSSDSATSPSRRTFVQASAAGLLSAASWQRVLGANERIGIGFIGYGLIGAKRVSKSQSSLAPALLRRIRYSDTDEANAAHVKTGAQGYIEGIQSEA
jgi:hypothetical protein